MDRPVAVVDATTTLYMVHVDHLNRPIKMTNAAKASVWDAMWLPCAPIVRAREGVNRQRPARMGGAHSITGTAISSNRYWEGCGTAIDPVF